MSFKPGQKVSIKGTDEVGQYLGIDTDGAVMVADGVTGNLKYYLPPALVEAVTEPITVTFDPAELPANVPTWFGHFEIASTPGLGCFTVSHAVDGGPCIRGKNIDYADARELALAILTVTDGPSA